MCEFYSHIVEVVHLFGRINKPVMKSKASIDLVKQSSSVFGFILSQVKLIPEQEQMMRQQRNTIAATERLFKLQRL